MDQEAERAVLGGLLLHNTPEAVLRLVRRGLQPGQFYWEQNGKIFEAMVAIASRREGIDPLTVRAELDRNQDRDVTAAYIDNLAGWVPAAGNIREYADRVREMSQWRDRLSVAYNMIEAIDRRDASAWQAARKVIAPDPDDRPPGPSVFRLVNEDGEVVSEETQCKGCQELEDQLKGAQTEIAGWRTRYANLERKKEEEARQNALWLPAQALFEHWKRLTGHRNSKWTADRFYVCEPLLRKYGVEVFERAVAGIAHDPYQKMRRNGSMQKYDSWATLCKGADAFEEYANRAPKGWKVTLKLSVQKEEEETTTGQQQPLRAVT